jgi:hypothetical protein
MFEILKRLFDTPQYVSRTDTTADSPDPDPNDVWLFTDPDARDEYAERGDLDRLEHDIRFEVMRGGPWQSDELEYKREVRRLLREGTLADKGTYWWASPHPTVYRARRDGTLTVGGRTLHFRRGDDIVFQCRMSRDMYQADEENPVPVLIARLERTSKSVLCGNMSGAMKGMGKM